MVLGEGAEAFRDGWPLRNSVDFRDQDPQILFCGVTKGASMASGSRSAWHDSAPRTVEVIFEDGETHTAVPRVLPMSAGQPERAEAGQTEAGQEDRCAGPGCGNLLERRGTGRPARYCCARCRQAARRKKLRAQKGGQFRDAGAPRRVTKPLTAWETVQREEQRPLRAKLASQRQWFLRRSAGELLRLLGLVDGPDEPATREVLRGLRAEIDKRQEH
jgi:hypothetical protein